MGGVSTYSFGVGNPSIDVLIQKQFPGVIFNATESPLGLYCEEREVNGALWQVVNATYSSSLSGWQQINTLQPSFAQAISNGGISYYSMTAGAPTPFTWVPSSPFSQYAIAKFTTSGTFTTPSNSTIATLYRYRMVGAGGGGGGAQNNTFAVGAGGGGGAYAEGSFSGLAPTTAVLITIGSGGAGGTNTGAGAAGGNTLIGAPVSISVGGGGGGQTSAAAGAGIVAAGGSGGVLVLGSPTVSIPGSIGGEGAGILTGLMWLPSQGGSSAFGSSPIVTALNGLTGVFPGNGGAGAALNNGAVGGAGAGGIVIIERMTV